MREITRKSANAFYDGKRYGNGNTTVSVVGEQVTLLLHGNPIARRQKTGKEVQVSACGWATPTTKERLNGISARVGACIWQENHVWYWQGPASGGAVTLFPTSEGQWTTIHYGSNLEQLARAKERQYE